MSGLPALDLLRICDCDFGSVVVMASSARRKLDYSGEKDSGTPSNPSSERKGTDPAIVNPGIPGTSGAIVGGVSASTKPHIATSGVSDSVVGRKRAKGEKERPSKRGRGVGGQPPQPASPQRVSSILPLCSASTTTTTTLTTALPTPSSVAASSPPTTVHGRKGGVKVGERVVKKKGSGRGKDGGRGGRRGRAGRGRPTTPKSPPDAATPATHTTTTSTTTTTTTLTTALPTHVNMYIMYRL